MRLGEVGRSGWSRVSGLAVVPTLTNLRDPDWRASIPAHQHAFPGWLKNDKVSSLAQSNIARWKRADVMW